LSRAFATQRQHQKGQVEPPGKGWW